jgi:signal peptidase I
MQRDQPGATGLSSRQSQTAAAAAPLAVNTQTAAATATVQPASTPRHTKIPDQPLRKTPIETPQPHSASNWWKDVLGLAIFVAVVVVGAMLINSFVFRSFNVIGPSMEPTLQGGVNGEPNDRLIVNLLPVTIAHIQGKDYTPARGQIIVFKNPLYTAAEAASGVESDEYIVKRVIGLPGDRVTVDNCTLTVYNSAHPSGFNPYPEFKTLAKNDQDVNTCVDGAGTDETVGAGELFVVGDHRISSYSMDSRNGGGRASLGLIPLDNVVGPVSLRFWPLTDWKTF